jgi:hypothetical protein
MHAPAPGKERDGFRREEGREGGGVRGSVNRGEDASATGLMLLPGFLSSKRKLEEGRIARSLARSRAAEIDND